MKLAWKLSFLLVFGLSVEAAFAAPLRIATGGKTDYVVVIPDGAEEVLKTAADELSTHLGQIIGTQVPIVEEHARGKNPAFVIGHCNCSSKAFADVQFRNAKQDMTAIRFLNGDVYLSGKMPTGPLYAVYVLLEEYCGVRWWTPTEATIPRNPDLAIRSDDYSYAPAIRCREAFYRYMFDGRQAARCRANGHFEHLTAQYGGKRGIIGWCHTFYQFLPPDKYFSTHPEWYSLFDGKRRYVRGQLCLTNPEMTEEFIKVCLERIAKEPDMGMISVSQNDWEGTCECPACKAIEAEEGSPSGLVLRFVNKVAAAIQQRYPEMLVETLAYKYTRKAPKITRPADNVVIRLCSIEMDFSRSLENGARNASFKKDIEAWSAIAGKLYIWNYLANFRNYLLPHPNYRNIDDDLRFFVKNHAIGVFEQGDATTSIGDFVRARAWITQHLLWNPEADGKVLAQEFFDGYYGPAGKPLMAYIEFLCDCVEKKDFNLRCNVLSSMDWLNGEDLLTAWRLYGKAEEAVKNSPVFAERVRRERLPLDLARLQYSIYQLKHIRYSHTETEHPALGTEMLELAKDYVRETAKWKPAQWREGFAFGDYAERIQKQVHAAADARVSGAPDDLLKMPPASWDYITTDHFLHHIEGTWCMRTTDAASPSGKASYMPNTHNQWALQYELEDFYSLSTPKWKARAYLRCDAAAKDGDAMTIGVYSTVLKKRVAEMTVPVSKIAGTTYVSVETPPFQASEGLLFFAAPVVREPKDVSKVYIGALALIAVP